MKVVEIKAPYSGKPSTLADRPDHEAQLRLAMECTGARKGIYVVEHNQFEALHVEAIAHDPDWLPSVLPALQAFYARYEAALKDPAEHLEPKVQEREDDVWVAAALAYRQAKHDADAAIRDLAECRRLLEEMADGRTCRGGGVRVTQVRRKGAIDWKRVDGKLGDYGTCVDDYRGEDVVQVRVTVEGG